MTHRGKIERDVKVRHLDMWPKDSIVICMAVYSCKPQNMRNIKKETIKRLNANASLRDTTVQNNLI